MKKQLLPLLLGAFLTVFTGAVFAVAGFSEVNNALFDSAHLKNIKQPGVLHYKFAKKSFTEGERDDTIDVTVSNIRNTGRADLHFDFFTGKFNRPYMDLENQQGNGIFVYFLEYDVHEMNRLTGGEWRYFQRKIRWAFAAGGTRKDIQIDYKGKQVPAIQYIIQPYANDEKNDRYKLYANKYYIFTLSDAIPGGVYQVRTIVPDGDKWQEGQAALVDESVTFTGYDAG